METMQKQSLSLFAKNLSISLKKNYENGMYTGDFKSTDIAMLFLKKWGFIAFVSYNGEYLFSMVVKLMTDACHAWKKKCTPNNKQIS